MPRLPKSQLTPEVCKALGLPTENGRRFSKDQARGYALRCLAPLAGLTQRQRERVLEQAVKINRT